MERNSIKIEVRPGYGRARLWLGISAVGSIVTLSIASLAINLPDRLQSTAGVTVRAQLLELLVFVIAYSLIQLPFDFLGGYLLPKRFGRSFPRFKQWLPGLGRGVLIHSGVLFFAAVAILLAGRFGGRAGTVAAGFAMALIFLAMRVPLASWVAPLSFPKFRPTSSRAGEELPMILADNGDEGFTGGIVGLFRPQLQILPERWQHVLGPANFKVAVARRQSAVNSGSWMRGRMLALLFTLAGLIFAACRLPQSAIGTAGGTIQFSLWFTLWSFAGLLVLPTFSRRGVLETDERSVDEGISAEAIGATIRLLDDLQDGEPVRPGLVETIFHPIPSVENRVEGLRSNGSMGYWDVARTSVYLSLAGIGLLGRAVHCNCGRPGLWVFLPTD